MSASLNMTTTMPYMARPQKALPQETQSRTQDNNHNYVHFVLDTTLPHLERLQKALPEETQNRIKENAHNYVSFVMSTFAQVMLEARGRPESAAREMAESAFFADMMGEAMADSDLGRDLEHTLQASMIEVATK